MKDILFVRFFDCYDTEGVQHSGFFENLDFSDYPEFEVLSDLVSKQVNMYLKNEYSKRYVISTWADMMNWNKTEKRWEVNPDFYEDFAAAMCSALYTAENYYQISQLHLDEVVDVIETEREYAKKKNTKKHLSNDTVQHGSRQDGVTTNIGAQTTTDTSTTAALTETTTNSKYAFDSAAWANDTKSEVSTPQHIDTLQRAASSRQDGVTSNIGQQTDTYTFGDITSEDDAHTDTETVTKTLGEKPELLLELRRQVAELNVYKIVGDAIAATMCRYDWGC